ncbi:MAG TPA: anti-sigma factor [Acidobacteriaceae bacterium]|jgi:anti-sigma-K factor RskA
MSPNQPANPIATFAGPNGPRHPNPDDLVLYAMQLLPAQDAAAVTQHLQQCADCRAELGHIRADLATFANTTDLQSPPASARQRLVDQVGREKKIVPIAPAQAPAHPPAQVQTAPPLAAFGRGSSVLSIEDHQPKRSGRTVFALAGWAAAACLAVGTGFLYKSREDLRGTLTAQTGQIQRLNTDAASAHQLMDALTDPKAVRVTLTAKPLPKTAPIGGVTYNPQKGSLVFLVSDLNPLQAYKTYELWVIPSDGTTPIPAGTFHPDDQGNAAVIMPDLPKGVPAKAFGVTIEDEGGAEKPTLPIIMAGS